MDWVFDLDICGSKKVFLQREAGEVNGAFGADEEVFLQPDGEVAFAGMDATRMVF